MLAMIRARHVPRASRRIRAALIALSFAAQAAALPNADPEAASRTERARKHYTRAIEHYDAGARADALREFRSAYALMGDARLLFNIGQLELELEEHARALRSLEQFLRDAQGSITAERRADVLRQLEALAEHTAAHTTVSVVPAPDAGARAPGGTAAVAAIEMSKARPRGEPASRDPGMPPLATATWISSGVLGLGALGTAAATLLASRRNSELRSTSSAPGEAPNARSRLDRQRELVQRLALATDVLALAALGSAGLGLYFTLTGDSSDASRVSVELGGGSLRVMGSF